LVEMRLVIPDELHKKLKHIAIDEDKTLKDLIIDVLRQYVQSKSQPQGQSKSKLREVLSKTGYATLGELVKTGRIKRPDRFISKAIAEGVKVFETPNNDYVLVDPDLWRRFEKEVLGSRKDPEEVGDEKLKSLLELLHKNAIVYLDMDEGWRLV